MRETEVAAAVKAVLEDRGADVYQEVVMRLGRADLVAVTSGHVAVVECKVTLGLDVIAQALRWLPYSNEIWVAYARRYRSRTRDLALELCANHGIGVYGITPYGKRVDVELQAYKHRPKGVPTLLKKLHPEQKTAAEAGTNGGGYVTDFRLTAQRLAEWVAKHPGATLKHAVGAIEHHYSRRASAIASLSGLLNRVGESRPAVLAGVRIEGSGAKARLWPQEGEF